jgi:hypothetical protein
MTMTGYVTVRVSITVTESMIWDQKLCFNQCQVSLGGPNMLTAEDKHDRQSWR